MNLPGGFHGDIYDTTRLVDRPGGRQQHLEELGLCHAIGYLSDAQKIGRILIGNPAGDWGYPGYEWHPLDQEASDGQ